MAGALIVSGCMRVGYESAEGGVGNTLTVSNIGGASAGDSPAARDADGRAGGFAGSRGDASAALDAGGLDASWGGNSDGASAGAAGAGSGGAGGDGGAGGASSGGSAGAAGGGGSAGEGGSGGSSAGGGDPGPTCSDGVANGLETDTDCGGPTCPSCGVGAACVAGSDCATGDCQANLCAEPSSCTEATAVDLGSDGDAHIVPNDGCAMVRDGYATWWGVRNMRLNTMDSGVYPVPVVWHNVCSEGAGSFTFGSDWQFEEFGPTDDRCATLIDLLGDGDGTVKLQYFSL